MHKKFWIILLVVLTAASFCLTVLAQEGKKEAKGEKAEYDYIGVDKCVLGPCHGKDPAYTTWLETKHATAYDGLTDEQKKDPEYIKYYTTGETKRGELLPGVQCEACHGPGSGYKTMKIMKDRDLAIANGLIMPDSTSCLSCHHADAPEKVAAIAKDFNYQAKIKTGIHALPSKEAEKK
jgi:cytochrome c553